MLLLQSHLLVILLALFFSKLATAWQVDITTTSCQSFKYVISGKGEEKDNLPTSGLVIVNGKQSGVRLTTSEPVVVSNDDENDEKETFEASGIINYSDLIKPEQGHDYSLSFTIETEEESMTATSAKIGQCSEEAAATTTLSTSSSMVVDAEPTATSSTTNTNLLPASSTSTTVPQSPTATSEQSPLETEEPSDWDNSSENEPEDEQQQQQQVEEEEEEKEKHQDSLKVKEGVSVGVLGILLLVIISLSCILVRRRKAKDARRERVVAYSQAWEEEFDKDVNRIA